MAQLVARRLGRVLSTALIDDIDAWWERRGPTAERIVATGHQAASRLAGRYIRDHAAIEGVTLEPVSVEPNMAEIATSLHVTGPVAFKKNLTLTGSTDSALRTMRTMLLGSANRLALNGDRQAVMGTFRQSRQITGWRRVTGGSPCAFCAMLASRGGVYRPGGGVSPTGSGITFAAHDSCNCSAEPLYEREPEPESVLELRDQWNEATAGLSGREALNAFRQARTS